MATKRFKVAWHYALQQRDPVTRQATDPRRSGGEYTYEVESKEAALQRLEGDLASSDWTQPFDAALIEASAWELLGDSDYSRETIINALRRLEADDLAALIAEVQEAPPAASSDPLPSQRVREGDER